MNTLCGQDKAGKKRILSSLSQENKGLGSGSTRKPGGAFLVRTQELFRASTSPMTMKSWSAALQFVAKMTKDRKYKQDNVGGPGKKHWAIPVLHGAKLGHVTPPLGSPQSSGTSRAHNCNFKPQEETELPQIFILLRKWMI